MRESIQRRCREGDQTINYCEKREKRQRPVTSNLPIRRLSAFGISLTLSPHPLPVISRMPAVSTISLWPIVPALSPAHLTSTHTQARTIVLMTWARRVAGHNIQSSLSFSFATNQIRHGKATATQMGLVHVLVVFDYLIVLPVPPPLDYRSAAPPSERTHPPWPRCGLANRSQSFLSFFIAAGPEALRTGM